VEETMSQQRPSPGRLDRWESFVIQTQIELAEQTDTKSRVRRSCRFLVLVCVRRRSHEPSLPSALRTMCRGTGPNGGGARLGGDQAPESGLAPATVARTR